MLRSTGSMNPWQLLDDMRERLERGYNSDASSGAYPLDVLEENDHLLVKVNLPGVDSESVQLSLENNTLTLTATVKDDADGKRYLYRERPVGTIRRAITLPVRLNVEQTEATLDNGVLMVRIAKAPEATARRISVQAGSGPRTLDAGQQDK
jgi:HSP20 family protein